MTFNISYELNQIQQRIQTLYNQAEHRFNRLFKRPYVRFDLEGESAGQALLHKHQLRFNLILLKENRTHFLEQTVAHEVAHLIAHELFGKKIRAHGKEWQHIMNQVFKLPADRCHAYDTQRTSRKPWLYQCLCKDGNIIYLGTTRHNRAKKGAVYRCTRCKGPLHFLKQRQEATSDL